MAKEIPNLLYWCSSRKKLQNQNQASR